MNAIAIFFKLAQRQGEIKRAISVFQSIRSPLTELIDLCRSLLGELGALDEPFSAPLAKYDTRWVQSSLNAVIGSKLVVDGDLGEATQTAVKAFQRTNPPLKVDGFPGVQTAAVLAQKMQELN